MSVTEKLLQEQRSSNLPNGSPPGENERGGNEQGETAQGENGQSEDADDEDEDRGISQGFDEHETYYPVFCLTEVPKGYFDDFYDHAYEHGIAWIEITSNNLHDVLKNLRADPGNSGPYPFLNRTVDEVYDIYKTHIRPADDSSGRQFITNYTFIVIDQECMQSNPKQCILCCDAPDFDEEDDEIKLKQLRMPLGKSMEYLHPLEMLCMAPSEVKYARDTGISVFPPAFVMPSDEEDPESRVYRVATPAEARFNKRVTITGNQSLSAGHLITTMECPIEEFKIVAQLYIATRNSAWTHNSRITFHDNRSDKNV